MGFALTGTNGQPVYNTTPQTVLDLQAAADYAALVGNTKKGTTTQMNALTGVFVWAGLLFSNNDDGLVYRYNGTTWKRLLAGLNMVKPTSAVGGTINGDGAISFASATSVRANGVFSSVFDNYKIIINMTAASASAEAQFNLCVGGVPNVTASSYTTNRLEVPPGGTPTGASVAAAVGSMGRIGVGASAASNLEADVFGPFLTRATSLIAHSFDTDLYARTLWASHNVAASFDGIQFQPGSGNVSGTMRIYGYYNG